MRAEGPAMLAPMDFAAATAAPWLVLGVVVGIVLAGMLAFAGVAVRRAASPSGSPPTGTDTERSPDEEGGWTEDDLPGFLDHPPGMVSAGTTRDDGSPAEDAPLAAPEPPAAAVGGRTPAPSAAATTVTAAPAPGRVLLVLAAAALVLVGMAAALAVLTAGDRSTRTTIAGTSPAES